MPVVAQAETEAVPYTDDLGTQIGSILIRELIDPFTAHDPAAHPADGQRYALVNLVFEAAEDQPFPTDPNQVQLLDTNGYLYVPDRVPRPPDSGLIDLQSQTLSPLDRVSGVVPSVLPTGASIARIIYRGG